MRRLSCRTTRSVNAASSAARSSAPFEPHRQRDHIARSRTRSGARSHPIQTLQEPQPPLRIGQRKLGRTALHQQRRTRRLRLQKPLRKRRNARRLEQAADADLHIQAGTNPADQPDRQQRMPAQFEEVVVDPDPLDTQNLRKQPAQDLLLRRAGRTPNRCCRKLRSRKRATVKLAVRRQRKTIQHHKRRRNHVVRQAQCKMRPQLRSIDRPTGRRHHIANQPLAPSRILARNHRALGNRSMTRERRLNLARLNAEPAQLDLRVRPTHKLQHPVRPPARQVPAAVHPAPRRTKRVRNKPLRRQTRTPQITPRQTRSRYVKLPNNPSRHRLQATVQDINPIVRHRAANRHVRAAFIAHDRVTNGIDRGFGRAIEIGDPCDYQMTRNFVFELNREELTTEREMIQGQVRSVMND